MSLTMLKQDAEILAEIAKNYDAFTEKQNTIPKEEYEAQLKNFRQQFLYLLTAIHKITEQEKNAK